MLCMMMSRVLRNSMEDKLMQDSYFEKLPAGFAKDILGDEYNPEEDYIMITEIDKFVINGKNRTTGEEREVTLSPPEFEREAPELIPFDKDAPPPYHNLGTLILAASVTIIILAIIFAIKI